LKLRGTDTAESRRCPRGARSGSYAACRGKSRNPRVRL
jgi:hypothetical protein